MLTHLSSLTATWRTIAEKGDPGRQAHAGNQRTRTTESGVFNLFGGVRRGARVLAAPRLRNALPFGHFLTKSAGAEFQEMSSGSQLNSGSASSLSDSPNTPRAYRTIRSSLASYRPSS